MSDILDNSLICRYLDKNFPANDCKVTLVYSNSYNSPAGTFIVENKKHRYISLKEKIEIFGSMKEIAEFHCSCERVFIPYDKLFVSQHERFSLL